MKSVIYILITLSFSLQNIVGNTYIQRCVAVNRDAKS